MPENNSPDSTLPFTALESGASAPQVFIGRPIRRRYWLHLLLFLATIFTTLVVGARMQYNFDHNLPAFHSDDDMFPLGWALQDPARLLHGFSFTLSLLGILLAHEMGHFILAARNRVYATLPYFIPFPTLIGTFGAFIRIRSPIRSRAILFDIGIAGPIAGFVVALPLLFVSFLLSKPGVENAATAISFGNPLIFDFAFRLLHGMGLLHAGSLNGLLFHPTAYGVWVGMFATALNLLPGGQLDGGHIVYALWPRGHRYASVLTVLALLPLVWYQWAGWLVWAVLLVLSGLQHPPVPAQPGIDRKRRLLALFALFMFVVTLMPAPFASTSLPEVYRQFHQLH